MSKVVGVDCRDMLPERGVLSKAFVAESANEIPPFFMNILHVFLQIDGLYNFAADDTLDVFVCDHCLVVYEPDVAVHVAEVSEHLEAMNALMADHFVMHRRNVFLERE